MNTATHNTAAFTVPFCLGAPICVRGRVPTTPCRMQGVFPPVGIEKRFSYVWATVTSRCSAVMSQTLSFSVGDLQAAKACIAAATAEVPIKLQTGAGKNAGPRGELLLSPVDLTQSNAIAQFLGESRRSLGHHVSSLLHMSQSTAARCVLWLVRIHRRIHPVAARRSTGCVQLVGLGGDDFEGGSVVTGCKGHPTCYAASGNRTWQQCLLGWRQFDTC